MQLFGDLIYIMLLAHQCILLIITEVLEAQVLAEVVVRLGIWVAKCLLEEAVVVREAQVEMAVVCILPLNI
jgi:hypothetical protein